jgi:hypothetical protein
MWSSGVHFEGMGRGGEKMITRPAQGSCCFAGTFETADVGHRLSSGWSSLEKTKAVGTTMLNESTLV